MAYYSVAGLGQPVAGFLFRRDVLIAATQSTPIFNRSVFGPGFFLRLVLRFFAFAIESMPPLRSAQRNGTSNAFRLHSESRPRCALRHSCGVYSNGNQTHPRSGANGAC